MAQEINLGGTIYVSSKRAAEITGYTQDYIGQLARAGSITAQRISGLWYVVEDSLRDYKAKADEFKPTPPPAHTRQEHQFESSISFDGKDYVSAQRAAEITGYHADYVGQLARTGKVVSRQVGTRWFVDREAVVEHKRHNDALLAAVQAESVGLMKQDAVLKEEKNSLHFNYIESVEPEPAPETQLIVAPEDEPQAGNAEESITEIPIRVIKYENQRHLGSSSSRSGAGKSVPFVGVLTVLLLVVISGSAGVYYAFGNKNASNEMISRQFGNLPQAAAVLTPIERFAGSVKIPEVLVKAASKSLYYRRDSF